MHGLNLTFCIWNNCFSLSLFFPDLTFPAAMISFKMLFGMMGAHPCEMQGIRGKRWGWEPGEICGPGIALLGDKEGVGSQAERPGVRAKNGQQPWLHKLPYHMLESVFTPISLPTGTGWMACLGVKC